MFQNDDRKQQVDDFTQRNGKVTETEEAKWNSASINHILFMYITVLLLVPHDKISPKKLDKTG